MFGMRAAPHGKEQETMERFNICYGCMNPLEEGAEILTIFRKISNLVIISKKSGNVKQTAKIR